MKKDKIIFIIGGARSGKSSFAIKLAQDLGKKVTFIATCEPNDNEMLKRIKIHKKSRPKNFKTIEVPRDIEKMLPKLKSEVVIVDCLTLLVSNLLCVGASQREIENKINKIIKILKRATFKSILVANEVGLGIVPVNSLARDFRDVAGRVNQLVAKVASKVYFMVAGIPTEIKL